MNYRFLDKCKYAMDNVSILDLKYGDVNGDGSIETVILIGKMDQGNDSAEDIKLVINNFLTNLYVILDIEENKGVNPTLFLGDFTGDKVSDILISTDSIFYIYSLKNNELIKIFDYREFNDNKNYDVVYKDNYKVEVIDKKNGEKASIGLEHKGKEYLDDIYNDNDKLIKNINGEIGDITGLYPIDIKRDDIYEVLIVQKILGQYKTDVIGYLIKVLSFQKDKFITVSTQITEIFA